jgi:hypothetical protein
VAPHAGEITLRGDTDFTLTGELDRWESQGIKFLFGMDAHPKVVQLAEALPEEAWKPLERLPRYEIATEPRRKAPRVKEAIVRFKGYLNKNVPRHAVSWGRDRLPYLAVNTTIVESDFDARASGTDPPPRSEKERGCLRRAFERFAGRVAPLCALLGQMIRRIKPSVGECWRGLRQLDNLEGILLLLGTKFKTSLLADYRWLEPGF